MYMYGFSNYACTALVRDAQNTDIKCRGIVTVRTGSLTLILTNHLMATVYFASLSVATVALMPYSVVSVCLSVTYVLWLKSKSYYWQPIGSRIWGIDWYQNEWPWPWPLHRGRLRSCKPLRHIRHWIYQKLLDIEAWFHAKITNMKWPMASRMVTWPMTSSSWAQYRKNSESCYLATIANYYR